MSESNVTDIKSNRKNTRKNGAKTQNEEKEKEANPPPKLTLGIIEEFLVRYFSEGELQLFMPKHKLDFPVYFHKPSSNSGSRIVKLDKKTGLASEIGFGELKQEIHKALGRFAIHDDPCAAYCLTHNHVDKLARRLLEGGRWLPNWPKPCGFAKTPDEGEYYFERHPFLPVRGARTGQFPVLWGFLERTENHLGLCQIIGSILAGKPMRKLNPLLYGPPGTGKSTLFRILKAVFGERACSNVPRTHGDKFATAFVENTAAWFADEVKSEFLRSDTFKNISGSDSYPVRKIGRDYVDVPLQGVFFMNCNDDRLELPNEDSIIRERLLGCRVEGTLTAKERIPPEEVLERAKAEFKYFIGYCLDLFEHVGNQVVRDDSVFDDIVSDGETDVCAIFDQYLIEDITASGRSSVVSCARWKDLWEKIYDQNPGWARQPGRRKEFNRYTAKRLGRSAHSQRVHGLEGKWIPGIRLR